MPDETEIIKLPNWFQFLKITPWLIAALTLGLAIGTWRSHQESALQSLSDQVQVLNKRMDQVDQGQHETAGKVMGLSERVDALHEAILEARKR